MRVMDKFRVSIPNRDYRLFRVFAHFNVIQRNVSIPNRDYRLFRAVPPVVNRRFGLLPFQSLIGIIGYFEHNKIKLSGYTMVSIPNRDYRLFRAG